MFLEILKPNKDAFILDLCCGQGRHSLEFARRGFLNEEGFNLFRRFERSKTMKNALMEYKNELRKENQKIFLNNLSESIRMIEELTRKGFLIKEGFDDSQFLKQIQKSDFSPRISGMYIIPTFGCNFLCRYCNIQWNLKRRTNRKMSKESLKKGIDLFIKNVDLIEDSEKYVTFYGGEPLLCFDIVKFAIEYLRKEEALGSFGKLDLGIDVITNGSLITEDIAKFFKDFNVGVAFSLDGREIDNDKMRQYPDGRGTFKDTVRGLRICQKYSLNIGISFTSGIHNASNLMENVKFLVEELGVKAISYNIIHDFQRGKNPAYVDLKLVIKNMMKTFSYLEGKGVFDERILRRWDSFIEKRPYPHDCSACGGQIVLLPDGYVVPCHVFSALKKYCIPLREDIDFRNEPVWQEWAKHSPFNMPQCKECNLITICGGGCPYSAMIRHGSIWDVDKDLCHEFVSKVLELYIWKAYDRMKDLPKEKEEKKGLFPIPITKWV